MNLVQERDRQRQERRLELYREVRARLKLALAELLPGKTVYIFGSLTAPGVFNDRSDIDVAIESASPDLDLIHLTGELMERLGRPVDVLSLDQCRFAGKILRQGEKWTL